MALRKEAFRGVRHYLTAGEKMPEPLFNEWMDTGRPALEGIGAITRKLRFSLSSPTDPINSCTRNLRRAHPGTEVKIISQDGDIIREPGEPGVLWVKMDSPRRWILEPLLSGRKRSLKMDGIVQTICSSWMKTGCMNIKDVLTICLKSARRVSPAEIEEEVLLHPKISEAAVVGIPNEDGLVRLALFLWRRGTVH